MPYARKPNTGPAVAAHMQRAAERGAADPATLARSVRVVRAGIELGRLSVREFVASAPRLSDEDATALRALLPTAEPTGDEGRAA